MSVRRARSRALALVLAASAVVAGVASSHASTADRLDHARARLRSLSTEIATQSRAVEDARAAAIAADARAVEADQALVPLTVQRILVAQRVADVQAQLAAAQQRFHDAVVQAFVAAPGTQPGAATFAAVLDANSFQDLQDQLVFGEAAANVRSKAIDEVSALDRRLSSRGATLDALISAAQDVRTRRDAALAEQQAALVREQQAMGALERGADRDRFTDRPPARRARRRETSNRSRRRSRATRTSRTGHGPRRSSRSWVRRGVTRTSS